MSWISELLQGIPLNAVLKERVQLAEEKFKTLEDENEQLKTRIQQLEDENKVLVSELAQTKPKESAKPKLHGEFYKFEGEEGHFCVNCFDSSGKKVRTAKVFGHVRECPQCHTVIDG